jgi:hypothetical protein
MHYTMKKGISGKSAAISLLLLILMMPLLPAQEMTRNISILSATDFEIQAEFILPPFSVERDTQKSNSFHRIRIAGWARTAEPGFPDLPLEGFLLEVPTQGNISLDILRTETESLSSIHLSPVSAEDLSPEKIDSRDISWEETLSGSANIYPRHVVKIGPRAAFRNLTVVRVIVHPFQWNPLTRELRYHNRIQFRIRFDSPLPPESGPGLGIEKRHEELSRALIINYKSRQRVPLRPLSKQSLSSPGQGRKCLKIEIKEDGIYRLTYLDLITAGIPPEEIDPLSFKLMNRGQETSLTVVNRGRLRKPRAGWGKRPDESNKIDDAKINFYIEFFGQKLESIFSDINVYWLYWGEIPGAEIQKIDGGIKNSSESTPSFHEKLHWEENLEVWASTPGAPETDFWFWERLTAPSKRTYALDISNPSPASHRPVMKVAFQGRSTTTPYPNHHALIRLNGTLIGDGYWSGTDIHIMEMAFPSALILNGPNTVSIDIPNDTGAVVDIIYLNWIELDYQRDPFIESSEKTFMIDGNGPVRIETRGLIRPDIKIFDITDPVAVKEVVNITIDSYQGAYKAVFEDLIEGTKTYYLILTKAIKMPSRTVITQTGTLKSPDNGADYLAIAPEEFIEAISPLCSQRESQGLRVKTVPLELIYDEFSFGLIDPGAIKEFLRYAYGNWQSPAPSYVLLVGDSNMDYRDYYGTGKASKVPVHLTYTGTLGLTPDDNWFVCVSGEDSLPDMSIGRLPGATPEAVADMADKILGFESSAGFSAKNALFVADNNDSLFEELNEDLIRYLPRSFNTDRVYLRRYTSVDQSTNDIIDKLNKGMMITNYSGHGAVTNWAGEFMFESPDIARLNNPYGLTFITTSNCLNGYFALPFYYSLAEEFILAKGKGAIACFSPSGLGYPWEHRILGNELYSSLFRHENTELGFLTTQAKIAAFGKGAREDILITFTLFGDPALKLKKW